MTQSLNVRLGTVLSVFQSFTPTFILLQSSDQFKRLDAVMKEFEIKDHREQTFLKIKIIALNRKTLPLYKRLDEKKPYKRTVHRAFHLFFVVPPGLEPGTT